MSCCEHPAPIKETSCHTTKKRDWFFTVVLIIGVLLYGAQVLEFLGVSGLNHLMRHIPHMFFELMNQMSWGIALGILFVGLLSAIPREYVLSVMGRPGSRMGIVRATLAGLLLDLCSHGILMVGIKLYERGASLGQVLAFLIASPWNSLSLTIILFTLIGFKWTLLFIFLSGVIALFSGVLFDKLVARKVLPRNPNSETFDPDFKFIENMKSDLRKADISAKSIGRLLWSGVKDSKMILKWILFGAILSSVIKGFVSAEHFAGLFGPTFTGLGLTLFFATIIEVCSEGSTPLAADLITRAAAPGNSFTFLMAGVSTDYTEIMSLKEVSKSWKIALFLPLVTIPQILVIAYILNQFG